MKSFYKNLLCIFLLNVKTMKYQIINGNMEDCYGFRHGLKGIFDHISIASKYKMSFNTFIIWSSHHLEKDSIHRFATCKHIISDNQIDSTIFFILKEDYITNQTNLLQTTKLEFTIDEYNTINYYVSPFISNTLDMEGCLGVISLKEYNIDRLLDPSIKYLIENFTEDEIVNQIQSLDKLNDRIKEDSYDFMSRYRLIIFDKDLARFKIFYFKLINLLADQTNLNDRIKDLLRSEIEIKFNMSWNTYFQDRKVDDVQSKIKFLSMGLIMDLFNIIELSKDLNYIFKIHSFLILDERLVFYQMACLSLDFSCVSDIQDLKIQFIDEKGNYHRPFLSKLNNKLYKCGFLKSDLIINNVNTIKCVAIRNGIRYETIEFKINY